MMMKRSILTLLICFTIFFPSSGFAWTVQSPSGNYTGPGDIITFTTWYSCGRAYSRAVAAAGTQKMCRIRNPSSGELCDYYVASNGGKGLTTNCTGAGAGQTVSSFCGGVDCKVHTAYDQRISNGCAGATSCDLVQATSGNQPTLSASDSYDVLINPLTTTVIMQSATNFTPNVAAKITLMGVGNVSNIAAANVMALGSNNINRNATGANTWVLNGSSGGSVLTGITDGAWHTMVGVLSSAASQSGRCAATSGCTFASGAPVASVVAAKFQILGNASATTTNKWREGGMVDNFNAIAADAHSLNLNASAYWGFTPP